ncbi:MAG TPA: radical SAM protein [Gemmatimonadaceae bacterium]|nr:radical SAM protein [Gemmatimonadaceae bacterium]
MVQNLEAKLAILMTMAADDREGMPGREITMAPPRLRNAERAGPLRPLNLRNVRVGQTGTRAKLLRVLMTNACSFNCHYCPMRRDRELPRTLLKAEEVVRIFLDARARGWADGLFLTTGIPGRPTKVMDDIIEVLDLLRGKHGYRGYIHVKIVPGADDAQVDRITSMANRVSINLETACGETLTTIAPEKKFETTLVALQRAQRRVVDARNDERAGKPTDALRPGGTAGITTQFVVGASKDSDRTIMAKSAELYGSGGMHHIHFSAFRPIRDTPLEHAPGAPPLREHRLYQADHLVRQYRFSHDELVFDGAGNLTLEHDPKVAWAIAHPERFPVELRTASREELLRVPGIGPLAARRIVERRRATAIRGLADLRALGVVTKWAQGFLTIAGRRLAAERWKEQLSLWKPEEEAGVRRELFEFSPGTFR